MRGKLFWRFFGAMTAVILITVTVFTAAMVTYQTNLRRQSYETEVHLQAEEVANYMMSLDSLSFIRDNLTLSHIVQDKITDIHDRYDADIWIVSYNSGIVTYLDSSWNTSESLATEAVKEQLSRIEQGEQIRCTDLFPELGKEIVTIGVPWTYRNGKVIGAVLLHISTEQLAIRWWELLPQVLPLAVLAVVVGIVVSLFLVRSLTQPIREIDNAVREFAKGDLTRRVDLHCGGELEALGVSINNMASDLSRMEESRRSFVSAVSHELRSPMTCMRGYVEAMLDGTISSPEQPKYLGIVLDETNRLTALVNDLLDLSRLESGKFPLSPVPFNANELFGRVLINFEKRINDKHVDVSVQFADDPVYATGDMNRITQVLSNIVDNALKFLPDEGGELVLTTESKDGCVRFRVQDNGSGITEEDLPHVFDRFYTADKAHTSGNGTGLGLSICRQIIRQHDSDITVSSVPGCTVFEFTLKACDPPVRHAPAEA